MRANIAMIGLTVLAASLAGCTFSGQVKQTEPFRVQIDGAPQEAHVSADDSGGTQAKSSEFQVENTKDVDQVTIVVEVTKTSTGGGSGSPQPTASASGNGTSGTTSAAPSNSEASSTSSQTAVILVIVEDRAKHEKLAERRVEVTQSSTQVNLDIDIKGRNNVVIVTQAVQGSADVAVSAEGGGSSGGGSTSGASSTVTATASPTSSTYP